MSVQGFKVYTSTSASSYTVWSFVDGVQELSVSTGRNAFIDPFRPSSATFTAWYPDGYLNPNTELVQGSAVKILRQGDTKVSPFDRLWTGFITNVTVEWGKTCNSSTGTGNGDWVTFEAEGAMAEAGRKSAGGVALSADVAGTILATAAAYGCPIGSSSFSPGDGQIGRAHV